MRWKSIKKLTDADLHRAWHHNLMFWNSCNGPHHEIRPAENGYWTADDVRREGLWTKFMVLPETA